MVARAQEVPSYSHLILPTQEDDYTPPVYYDLTQSCCTRPVYVREGGGGQEGMALEIGQVDSSRDQPPKKRKAPSCHEGSDDDALDDCKSVRTDDHKKQNHSEIEKRRRDKMNTYITELSAMVPMCHALSRKLDKLTVLRMAVQHMKAIRGAVASYTDGNYKPAFLSDLQLKQVIKQAAEGFLFVVGCDRGRILYVSESVTQSLNYSQSDLLGQSWFDILHPKDVAKVKEQLSSSHLSTRDRYIDAKTMMPVKTEVPQSGPGRLSPGSRRSFFCRMKCRSGSATVKEEADTTTGFHRRKKQQAQHTSDKKYRVIHCTGYLKPWGTGEKLNGGQEEEDDRGEGEGEGELGSLSCLVAMGRVVLIPFPQPRSPQRTTYNNPINVRPLQFISRHTMDGKFLFVDQRATLVLGFLPQELLGTSMYEYYCKEDIPHLAESHKAALQSKESVKTKIYKFRSKEGNYVNLQSEWKSFRNPWTKEGEYLVAKNSRLSTNMDSIVESSVERLEGSISQTPGSYDYYSNCQSIYDVETLNFIDSSSEMAKFVSSNVEASNIGRQIAEEVIDELRKVGDSPPLIHPGTPSPSRQPHLEVGPKYPPFTPSATASDQPPTSNLGLFNDFPAPQEEIMSVLVTINKLGRVHSPSRPPSIGLVPSSLLIPPRNFPSSLEGTQSRHMPQQHSSQLHSGISPGRISAPPESNGGIVHRLTESKSTPCSDESYTTIRNNVTLSSLGSDPGGDGDEMMEMIGSAVSAVSPAEAAPSDGNDEAAMAVIMSLLEADAGLGGPVDFTGLPWPLP